MSNQPTKELQAAYEQYRSNPTEATMETLYPLVREKVKRTVRFQLHAEPDEDLVVSTTTDVLMRIDKFNPKNPEGAGFSTWAETVIRNLVIDHLRKSPKKEDDTQPPAFQQYAFDKVLDGTEPEEPSTDSAFAFAELYERIETVLTEEERQILFFQLKGLNDRETSGLYQLIVY